MRSEISVLLVDDLEVLRRELRRLLKDDSEIAVIGEARNGREAVEFGHALHPDVVVMDLGWP